jgi:hypothetical protein
MRSRAVMLSSISDTACEERTNNMVRNKTQADPIQEA